MRSAAAALIAFPATLFAHSGHGALEGHVHGWGVEHAVLFAVMFGLLILAVTRK